MKKLLLIGCSVCAIVASAVTVKYTDLYTYNLKNKSDVAKTNIVLTVENLNPVEIRYMNTAKLYKYSTKNKDFTEAFDTVLSEQFNKDTSLQYSFVPRYLSQNKVRKIMPKTLAVYTNDLARIHPVRYAGFVKYNRITFKRLIQAMTLQELLDVYPEVPVADLNSWKRAVVNKVIPSIKIQLRKEGKTFISRVEETTNAAGEKVKVTINPLDSYTKTLSTALNAGRLAGLNEFLASVSLTETFDASRLPTEDKINALVNDVLIDKANIKKLSVREDLEKCLGVEGFNKLIKVYNEGGTL